MVQQWEGLRDRTSRVGKDRKDWTLPARYGLMDRVNPRDVSLMRDEVMNDFESIKSMTSRLSKAADRVAVWDLEDVTLNVSPPASSLESEDTDQLKEVRTDRERMFTPISKLEVHIAEESRYWNLRIQAQKIHVCEQVLLQQGRDAATQLEDAWTTDEGRILEEMDEWLEAVLRTKTEQISKGGISSATEVKLSAGTRKWLDHLVPGIWDVLAAPERAE